MAFAFNAAIEARYAIENNVNNPNLSLADAYLDYKVWGTNNFKTVLEQGFKVPLKVPYLNNFPPNCSNEFYCHFVSQTRSCINDVNGQQNYQFEIPEPGEPTSVSCGGPIGQYVTVNNVDLLTNIFTEDDLKTSLLANGPLVLRVDGWNSIIQFRNYPSTSLSYHSFAIIGWQNTSTGVKWLIKDSWPGMTSITYTLPNPPIAGNSNVQLFKVNGIRLNNSQPGSNLAQLTTQNCVQQVELSSISVQLDEAYLDGRLYHRFSVSSNLPIDTWTWGIDYPNGSWQRSQNDTSTTSTVLLSPNYSGVVTVFVNAFRNGIKYTKERVIYLSNGEGGGMQ